MSAWISCADRMPEMAEDELGYDDIESRWVLARQASGNVYVALLRSESEWNEETDEVSYLAPRWIGRGPCAYVLEDVVEWAEIPA